MTVFSTAWLQMVSKLLHLNLVPYRGELSFSLTGLKMESRKPVRAKYNRHVSYNKKERMLISDSFIP